MHIPTVLHFRKSFTLLVDLSGVLMISGHIPPWCGVRLIVPIKMPPKVLFTKHHADHTAEIDLIADLDTIFL